MDSKNLSPEFLEKAKACTSPEELENLAKEGRQELSLDSLESASGGIMRDGVWICNMLNDDTGDTREGIDPSHAHADFVNGDIDAGEYF